MRSLGVALLIQSVLATVSVVPTADAQPARPLGTCADPWGESPGLTGPARRVHPDVLRERYAVSIVAKQWPTVVAAYAEQIDSAMADGDGTPSADFIRLRTAFASAAQNVKRTLIPALAGPASQFAEALASAEINQFRPVNSGMNTLVFLQGSAHPLGVPLDTASLSLDERRLVCWSAWSMYRLFQNINFETIPGALVRVESQARRWERYRSDGPMQLPHELVLNRVKRAVRPARGSDRFSPPRFDLVAFHPFAALELVRSEGQTRRVESLAMEVAGATIWVNDWKQHVGASWVLAYGADGRIGRGLVVRAGGYATAGALQRRDATGLSRTSLLFMIDALRLLKPDVSSQARRQTQNIAGEILSR